MDYQRRGACSHIMAASDPHLRCPGCRDCFLPGNPCSVCESLSAEQVALAIQARSLRLRRQARRAGSTDSSQCGPLEDKAGLPGSTPDPSVLGQRGEGFTSPRSIRSRDGGRGSPSAESLSSLAGEDGDSRRNTSLGPRSQDGGSGARLTAGSLTPRGSDQLRRQQAFRRRSRTPVREHDRSRSASSDLSEADRSVAASDRPVDRPVEAADRTGRSADGSRGSTGPAGRVVRPDRPVRPSDGLEPDRPVEEHRRTGRSGGSTGPRRIAGIFLIDDTPVGRIAMIEADLVGDVGARFRALRCRTASLRRNLGESDANVGMAGADTGMIVLRRLPALRVWLRARFCRRLRSLRVPRTPWHLGWRVWSGGRVLRTLSIRLSPHGWRSRVFLCCRRGTHTSHRRTRVAVIGAHNTETATVSPKCCRATVGRRWLRHGQRPRSRWAVTRLFRPVTRRPGGVGIPCKGYSPSTPPLFHRMYQWTMCLGVSWWHSVRKLRRRIAIRRCPGQVC